MLRIYNIKQKRGIDVSPHFYDFELACPCCGYALVDDDLMGSLEKLRDYLGVPITVNSGYRCPKHNAAEGGKIYSRHLMGCAVDITWKDFKVDQNLVDKIAEFGFTALGVGSTFIHVDTDKVRAGFARWTY